MVLNNKKYNICITTYFNKKYEAMGKLCLRSAETYAHKNGYDVKLLNDISSNRPANWNKLIIAQELFRQGYDFILWIDADAIFVRFDEDIATEIEPGKDLYLARYRDDKGESPNTGVLLIRNSPWSKMVLEKMWNFKKYINWTWKDQAAFLELFGLIGSMREYNPHFKDEELIKMGQNSELLEKVKWLDMKWNNFLPTEEITLKWHRFLPKMTTDKPIINHYAGLPDHVRMLNMTQDARQSNIIPLWMQCAYMCKYYRSKIRFVINSMISKKGQK